MIRNLIKIAKLIFNGADVENFPQAQVTYMGNVCDLTQVLPYGLTSRAPDGDALFLVLSQQGNEGSRLGIPFAPTLRKRNLKSGETVIENMIAESFLYLDENGNLEIKVPADIIAAAKNIIINAESATVTLNTLEINAQAIVINCPTATLNGNFIVNGNINSSGTITGATDVVSDTISLRTHQHPNGTLGNPTGAPIP